MSEGKLDSSGACHLTQMPQKQPDTLINYARAKQESQSLINAIAFQVYSPTGQHIHTCLHVINLHVFA